jgi:hypothetical protein
MEVLWLLRRKAFSAPINCGDVAERFGLGQALSIMWKVSTSTRLHQTSSQLFAQCRRDDNENPDSERS